MSDIEETYSREEIIDWMLAYWKNSPVIREQMPDGNPLTSIEHPGGDTEVDISDESTEQIEYDGSEVKINTIIHMIDPYHPRRFVHKSATEAPSEFNRDQLERIISVCKRLIYNR